MNALSMLILSPTSKSTVCCNVLVKSAGLVLLIGRLFACTEADRLQLRRVVSVYPLIDYYIIHNNILKKILKLKINQMIHIQRLDRVFLYVSQ